MKKIIIITTLFLLCLNIYAIGFLNENTGIGFGLGSGGYEVKGIYRFNNYFSSSVEYNNMGLDNISFSDDSNGDIEVAGTLKISSVKGLIHYHPFGGGFRISAGYTYNLSNIEVEVEGTDIVLDEENPSTTTSDITGTITINTGSTLPYVGVAWGYSYEDFISLDLGLGIQFIPKLKGSDLISYDIAMEAAALDAMVDEVVSDLGDSSSDTYQAVVDAGYDPAEVATALESTAVQAAIAGGDPFELYEVLESEGILEQFGIDISSVASYSVSKAADDDNPFGSLPNPDDYLGDIQTQIDQLVEESGLGAVQDLIGYAPLPVFSFGFTLFFY
jgi:hypothetical protein